MNHKPDRNAIAEEYLDVLEAIRATWSMCGDGRRLDTRRKDLYQGMLDVTGKTAEEFPNGQKLAYDILDGKL
jgi:hypothetical protein